MPFLEGKTGIIFGVAKLCGATIMNSGVTELDAAPAGDAVAL